MELKMQLTGCKLYDLKDQMFVAWSADISNSVMI